MIRKLPHEIILPKINELHLWTMREWCESRFGTQWNAISRTPEERLGTWTVFWCGPNQPKDYRWHFKNEQDAVIFTLRWR